MAVILIIVSDKALQTLISQHLQLHQYRVVVANSCQQGQNLTALIQPSLILLDFSLKCHTLTQQITAGQNQYVVPVIYLLEDEHLNQLTSEILPPVFDFLLKPLRLAELLARIKLKLNQTKAQPQTTSVKPVLATGSHNQDQLNHFRLDQLSLEQQNRLLRDIGITAENALERYTELFDLGPSAYYILSPDSTIHQCNFRGAQLLARERSKLIGQRFCLFVSAAQQSVFMIFLSEVFASRHKHNCELSLKFAQYTYQVTIDASVADTRRKTCLINVTDISELKATERSLQQSRSQLRALSAQREETREQERKRIAREMHDELGQRLTALRMDIALIRLRFGEHNSGLNEQVQAMLSSVDATIQVVRNVASTIRPPILDMGVVTALEWLVDDFYQRTNISCSLTTSIAVEHYFNSKHSTAIFRIVQESLTNIIRHAEAKQVRIGLSSNHNGYQLEIQDNGKGFEPANHAKQGSFGLIGIEERVLLLGAKLTIDTSPGKGVRLCVQYSVEAKNYKD